MSIAPGTRIGAYDVSTPIGAGGMGQVYRATDSKLHRDVALKVLPPSVATDPERLARFRREAQVLAALNHPNIAHVYGLEQSGDVLAIAMELVDGPTLAELIGQPMPLPEALPLARQIAEALEFAHEQGIVHRDLKPANIKVRPDGAVKVLDFGLAKALTGGADATTSGGNAMNSPTLTARSTQLGMILGTAAYMSPEQAKARPVDRRADIWAFGVVLYEMLSGRRGYQAEDISETLAAVLTRDVDWNALPASTPPRLIGLIRDCLARDPRQRLRDIGEARRVLDQLASGAPDTSGITAARAGSIADTAPPSRRPLLPWLLAGAGFLTAAAALVIALKIASAPPPRTLVTRSRVPLKDLSGFVALSHDGAHLAYTVTGGPQGFYIGLRPTDQFDGKPLAGSDGGLFPVFSPDGNWIAFSTLVAPLRIRKVPVGGGASVPVSEGTFVNGGDWGGDDTIVFSASKGLMSVPASGGTPQALTTLDTARGETLHTRPQFLPDGRHLLFTVVTSDGPTFAVLDLAAKSYRIITAGGDNGRYVPSGHLTFVRDSTLFAVPFDLRSLSVTGTVTPVADAMSAVGPVGTGDYTFSDDGLLVYSEAASSDSTLAWIDRKGTVAPIPGQIGRRWGTGRLSPDGLRVANGIHGEKGSDIWVVDLVRGTPTRVTFDVDADRPMWTPDGKRVVYGAPAKDHTYGIFSVAADGSGQPEAIFTSDLPSAPSSFSPDGQTMLLTQVVSGQGRIMVLPPAPAGTARTPHPLHDVAPAGGETLGSFSPDGKWVALVSTESGSAEIYLVPYPGPGPKIRVSTQGARDLRWARQGLELLFWTPSPGQAAMMSATIKPGTPPTVSVPTELFRYYSGSTWDTSPDANRFLIERFSDDGARFVTVTNWFDELVRKAPPRK